MSRIGKKPIVVPDKVNVTIDQKDVTVKGPKGQLSFSIHPNMSVKQEEDGTIVIERPDDQRQNRALHGLTRALIANMVAGVSTGFRKSLIVEGVGYTSDLRGKDLVLKLGYSHEIVFPPPEGITFEIEDRGRVIHISGYDKQVVGQTAAEIRELRPPEPYKGKGIRYNDEVIRRKAGKAGKTK
jgi:large subunit ribosomal protein L6